MLVVRNLRKTFGSNVAVDGIDLDIPKGTFFGLLGPNGAGKTTTISMIVGTLNPDSGEILIGGRPMNMQAIDAKRQIGYVPQDLALYEELTARRNLEFFGALYGLEGSKLQTRIGDVLGLVGLQERASEAVSKFSGGMKRRLNIAVGMLHDPELLILDEPTVGVDPQSRNAIFDALKALNDQGKTLLYTTHYMEEVERLCDQVAIMDKGRILATNSLSGLQEMTPGECQVLIELDQVVAVAFPDGLTKSVAWEGTVIRIELHSLNHDLAKAIEAISNTEATIRSIRTPQASLEEVFLNLTGRNLRD